MSTYLEDKYPRWFVYDSYTPAGRPKLEYALMTWANANYMYCLISEKLLSYVIEQIKKKQDELWEQNKRLKKVEIRLSQYNSFHPDNKWLYIGEQHLALRKVRDEIE